MRFGAAFSCQPWSVGACQTWSVGACQPWSVGACQPGSVGACRSVVGRCHSSRGRWFWVGRDVLEVRPFPNRLTLLGVPALSRPNVGRDQIAAIACPSRLCLFHGTRTVHTSLSC